MEEYLEESLQDAQCPDEEEEPGAEVFLPDLFQDGLYQVATQSTSTFLYFRYK